MKKSEILRVARGLIERKTKHTICSALIGVVVLTPGCHVQVEELRKWVKGMLGSHSYYEDWLHFYAKEFATQHGVIKVNWTPCPEDRGVFDAARPGRLQWMDWMIEFWEKEEANTELKKALNAIPYNPPKIKPPTIF